MGPMRGLQAMSFQNSRFGGYDKTRAHRRVIEQVEPIALRRQLAKLPPILNLWIVSLPETMTRKTSGELLIR